MKKIILVIILLVLVFFFGWYVGLAEYKANNRFISDYNLSHPDIQSGYIDCQFFKDLIKEMRK